MANRVVGERIIDQILDGKRVLITGGTGSLGKVLLRRLLAGTNGSPSKDHRDVTR